MMSIAGAAIEPMAQRRSTLPLPTSTDRPGMHPTYRQDIVAEPCGVTTVVTPAQSRGSFGCKGS